MYIHKQLHYLFTQLLSLNLSLFLSHYLARSLALSPVSTISTVYILFGIGCRFAYGLFIYINRIRIEHCVRSWF